MKIFKPLIVIFLSVIANTSFTQDTIHWRHDYKLKWEDFQGVPDSNSSYKAISSPVINYNLSYNDKSLSCKVFCYFKKKKSWIAVKDSILLKHEQGHFDIAELFARKFRKKVKEYKFNHLTANQDIEKIFKGIIIERAKLDALYDKETNLSRNKSKQFYWTKKILSELKKLELYKE